jgi:hypothetical protein
VLKNKIKKKQLKKTRVNLLNLDNPLEGKSKQIMKSNSQSIKCCRMKLKKKIN